jgi:hypothetical protein
VRAPPPLQRTPRFGASQRKLGELHNVSYLPLSDRRQTHIKQRHVSDRKSEAAFELKSNEHYQLREQS